jgi:hypothetical protein
MNYIKIYQNDNYLFNDLIVLIIGAGFDNEYEMDDNCLIPTDIKFIKNSAKTVIQIGQIGDNGFTLDFIKEKIAPFAKNADKITILSNIHGHVRNNEHYIENTDFVSQQEEDCEDDRVCDDNIIRVYSKDFFQALNEAVKGKKIDLFSTSCHGNAAQNIRGSLPFGSKLITLSDIDKETIIDNLCNKRVSSYVNSLNEHNKLDIDVLLDIYLANQHVELSSPAIGISGEGVIYLEQMQKYLGNKISLNATKYINDNFGKVIINLGLVTNEQFDHVIDQIQINRDLQYFKPYDKFLNSFKEQFAQSLKQIDINSLNQSNQATKSVSIESIETCPQYVKYGIVLGIINDLHEYYHN